jgi:hypothetical protein
MSRQARPIFIKPTLMLILLRNLLKSLSNVQTNVLFAFIYNALHSIIYTKFVRPTPYYYHHMGAIINSNFNLGDSNA